MNFITGRNFIAKINDFLNNLNSVTCSVPQGLGLLEFLFLGFFIFKKPGNIKNNQII